MLSNLEKLPVTRSIILDSGMGKAIGTVEKHALVKGTPNEAAVKSRVQQIKDSWQASVKERKAAAGVQVKETKRSSEAIVTESPPSGKKIKTEVSPKKISSFSSLLKKVSRGPNGTNASDIPAVASNGTDQKLDDKTLGGETDGPIEKKGKRFIHAQSKEFYLVYFRFVR